MVASRNHDVMTTINPTKDFPRFAVACKLEQVHIACEQMLDLIERINFPHLTSFHKVGTSSVGFGFLFQQRAWTLLMRDLVSGVIMLQWDVRLIPRSSGRHQRDRL